MAAGLARSLPQVVRRALQSALADHHHALPGVVQAYNASTNLADVEVLVQHPVFDDDGRIEDYESLGVLVGVPVKMPRAGGFLISLPLAKGDTGELVFHSSAIGEWRQSGQKSKSKDISRHSIGWPTFRPDLFADANPIASSDLSNRQAGIVIGKEGGDEQILIQSGLVQIGKTGAGFVALAASAATELGKIATSIGQCATYINGISPGTVTPYSPSSVASTLLKAK